MLELLLPAMFMLGFGAWMFSTDTHDHTSDGTHPDENADIRGTDTDDTLSGSDGTDVITAGAGNDYIIPSDGNDTVYGGAGDDNAEDGFAGIVYGGDGNDALSGHDSAVLYGEAGNDTLSVGHGATAYGGTGDDLFFLGPGATATLGNGTDSIVVNASGELTNDLWNAGPATVTDYTAGRDHFRISSGYGTIDENGDAVDIPMLNFSQNGSDVVVTMNSDRLMVLSDTTLADLNPLDFKYDGQSLLSGINSNIGTPPDPTVGAFITAIPGTQANLGFGEDTLSVQVDSDTQADWLANGPVTVTTYVAGQDYFAIHPLLAAGEQP